MELALKIASKIRAGQMFTVYVVIPMFPEGPPESAASQEILFFQVSCMRFYRYFRNLETAVLLTLYLLGVVQYQTVQMMYRIVADALKQKGLLGERKPQDYLLFFCLGNREEKPFDEQQLPAQPTTDPHQVRISGVL